MPLPRVALLLLRFLLVLIAAVPGAGQAQERPTLLVLGSSHFGNPGRDAINLAVEDVLTPQRQQEIAAVVQQLAAFRPTRIAIEVPGSRQAELDRRYQNYRDGTYELTRNESDQLGLRLAALLGHERIYAVDWNQNPPGPGTAEDYDWYSYGQAHGDQALIDAITDPERARRFVPELKEQSIGAWLLQLNDPAALALSHRTYFDIASIGDGDNLIGATWVGGAWYARNLKIYTRLVDLAPTPEERVLVIYGQGHAYLLRQFAREHAHFDLVDVDAVLAAGR